MKRELWFGIKNIFGSAGFLFLLAAGIVFFCGDLRRASVDRLNNLAPWREVAQTIDGRKFSRYELLMTGLYFKTLIRAYPGIPDGYDAFGWCYVQLGRVDSAKRFYREGFLKNPNAFWLAYNAGVLEYGQGHRALAKEYFDRIVRVPREKLLAAAVLSGLPSQPADVRQQFMAEALRFAMQVRSQAWQALVVISEKKGDKDGAAALCGQALQDESVGNKLDFIRKLVSLKNGSSDGIDFDASIWKVVIHPWGKVIPVGRAYFY